MNTVNKVLSVLVVIVLLAAVHQTIQLKKGIEGLAVATEELQEVHEALHTEPEKDLVVVANLRSELEEELKRTFFNQALLLPPKGDPLSVEALVLPEYFFPVDNLFHTLQAWEVAVCEKFGELSFCRRVNISSVEGKEPWDKVETFGQFLQSRGLNVESIIYQDFYTPRMWIVYHTNNDIDEIKAIKLP